MTEVKTENKDFRTLYNEARELQLRAKKRLQEAEAGEKEHVKTETAALRIKKAALENELEKVTEQIADYMRRCSNIGGGHSIDPKSVKKICKYCGASLPSF